MTEIDDIFRMIQHLLAICLLAICKICSAEISRGDFPNSTESLITQVYLQRLCFKIWLLEAQLWCLKIQLKSIHFEKEVNITVYFSQAWIFIYKHFKCLLVRKRILFDSLIENLIRWVWPQMVQRCFHHQSSLVRNQCHHPAVCIHCHQHVHIR